MIEALFACVLRAHKTVRGNLVAVWFPALFGVATFVVFLLIAVVLILPIVPDILTRPNPAVLASPAVVSALFPRILFLAALALPLLLVADAGTLYLQAQAVRGQAVDTSHFFLGMRKLSWRLLTGRVIEWVLYGLLFAPLLVSLVREAIRLAGPEGAPMLTADHLAFRALMQLLPLAVFTGVMYIAVGVLLSMWARVLALREVTMFRALIAGASFARAHFFSILLVFIGQWMLASLLQRVLGQGELAGMIGLGLGYVLRVYAGLTLMHLYELRTAAPLQPAADVHPMENGG